VPAIELERRFDDPIPDMAMLRDAADGRSTTR